MKSIKMLLMAALTIFSVSVFAQADQKAKTPMKKGKPAATVQYTCPMDKDVVSNKPGKCPKCGMDLVKSKKAETVAAKMYTCPMHPEVVTKGPGKCPKCGMELVEKKNEKSNTKMKM